MFGMGKKRSGFPGVITGYGGGTFDMDGTEVIPQIDPNEIRYTPEAQRAMNNAPRLEDAPKRQSYWQGGDKFTGRDALAAGLAAIGDGFSTWANGPSAGGATGMLIGGRGKALEEAKKAQAQAQAAAEAERMRQQQRAERPEDLRAELKVRGEFKDPTPPRFEQDNAGNIVALDPYTGKQIGDGPTWVDRNPRYTFQNGAVVKIPNIYDTGPSGQQEAPDRLPANFFDNPPGGQAPQSAAQPGPVPRLQSPQLINQQQYAAKLREFGGDQMSMNAWMRANNIIAGN